MRLKIDTSANTTLNTISLVFFLFILAAVILITQNPATGYELSIYSATPSSIWALLIIAIIGGTGIVVYQAAAGNTGKGYWWQTGLLLILLGSLIIILLPTLRGYAFLGRGDHLTYLGQVKDIVQTGSLTPGDIHPVITTVISELCIILNISPTDIMPFVGPLFYLLFVLFTFLLCQEVLPKTAAILATAASCILIAGSYDHVFAMGMAFLTFPLVFYLYFKYQKRRSFSCAILVVGLIILMTFFHPMPSLLLTVALVIMELSKLLYGKWYTGGNSYASPPLAWWQRISLTLPAISLIVNMLWIWSHWAIWEHRVSTVASQFHGVFSQVPVTQMAQESFTTLGLGPLAVLDVFIKLYGHIFVYAVLSLIAVIIVARNRTASADDKDKRGLFLYSCFFLFAAALCLIDYVKPLTTLSSGRAIYLIVVLFPPLVGLTLYRIILKSSGNKGRNEKPHGSKLARSLAAVVLIGFCFLVGILGTYRSPLIHQPNLHVTHAEFAGMKWLVERGSPEVWVTGPNYTPKPRRFASALEGTSWGWQATNYPQWAGSDVADHFNYTRYQTLGESLAADSYMPLGDYITRLYTELWKPEIYPGMPEFSQEDFARLKSDPSLDLLYTNGDMDIWYVQGQRRQNK
jgi:hypothetical protein